MAIMAMLRGSHGPTLLSLFTAIPCGTSFPHWHIYRYISEVHKYENNLSVSDIGSRRLGGGVTGM
jgi:hypothetical protein